MLPRDGLWGAQDENGTWNGIIKDLQDKVSRLKFVIRAYSHQKKAGTKAKKS